MNQFLTGLPEIFRRIAQRLEVVGLSERAASEQAGLCADGIRTIRRAALEGVQGRGGVSTRTLAALAPVLKCRAGWLLDGIGQPEDGSVASRKDLDERLIELDIDLGQPTGPDVASWSLVSPNLGAGWVAMAVPDSSMDRIAPAGSSIFADGGDKELRNGQLYVGLFEGELLFRRWFSSPERLETYSRNSTPGAIYLEGERWAVVGRVRRAVTEFI